MAKLGGFSSQFFSETAKRAGLRQAIRNIFAGSLYANSVYLMINAGMTATMGFIFWTTAARLYQPEHVGLGLALISTGTLLSYVAGLGLGNGLIRFLSGINTGKSRLVNSSITISASVGAMVGSIFIVGIPWWSPAFASVRQTWLFSGLFIIFILGTTVLDRLGEVFVALRRGKFVLLLYSVAGLGKVALLFLLAAASQNMGILMASVAAIIIALGVGMLLFLPRALPGYLPIPNLDTRGTGKMIHFSLATYIGSTFWNMPHWLLPVLIVNVAGAVEAAFFYMSWYIAWFLHSIPSAASLSLFAEGSSSGSNLKNDIRKSLKLVATLLLPAATIAFFFGGKVLLVFGAAYSQEGEQVLRLLVPASIPLAINIVYLGIARVRGELRNIVLLSAGMAVGTFALGYPLLTTKGIIGPAISWLVSNSLAALIVTPSIVKLLRSEPHLVSGGANVPGVH